MIEGRAVALVAPSGGGKSSFAAALVRRGHEFLTDDILPIQVAEVLMARPGYPRFRLWPESMVPATGLEPDFPFLVPGSAKRRALWRRRGGKCAPSPCL